MHAVGATAVLAYRIAAKSETPVDCALSRLASLRVRFWWPHVVTMAHASSGNGWTQNPNIWRCNSLGMDDEGDNMMTEQLVRFSPPRHSLADSFPNRAAERPTESSPAEIHALPTRCAMSDAERLDELRTKLRRIEGHKELSPKQEQAALGLIREIAAIEGTDWVAEVFS